MKSQIISVGVEPEFFELKFSSMCIMLIRFGLKWIHLIMFWIYVGNYEDESTLFCFNRLNSFWHTVKTRYYDILYHHKSPHYDILSNRWQTFYKRCFVSWAVVWNLSFLCRKQKLMGFFFVRTRFWLWLINQLMHFYVLKRDDEWINQNVMQKWIMIFQIIVHFTE